MLLEETVLVEAACAALSHLLPPSWTVTAIDSSLVVRSPVGVLLFDVEARTGAHAGAGVMVDQIARRSDGRRGVVPLLVMPYIGPAVRRACQENGINFIDQTGWAWINVDDPPIVIRTDGAARDPGPGRKASMNRLAGPGAGRVLRALLHRTEPIGVRALAHEAGVSAGTVSKLLKSLQPDGSVQRDDAGNVVAVDKRALADRWIQDYQFLRANKIGRWLAPRGLPRVLAAAAEADLPIVGTGSVALRHYLPPERIPVTGLAQVALYVADPARTSEALRLTRAEPATTTVFLAVPYDNTLLDLSRPTAGQLRVVDVGQAVADLLTLPGRGPEEAEQLMEVLAENDSSWG